MTKYLSLFVNSVSSSAATAVTADAPAATATATTAATIPATDDSLPASTSWPSFSSMSGLTEFLQTPDAHVP